MKIAIVGASPGSKDLAPYDDESWEIWGIGVHAPKYTRLSRIFEIHDRVDWLDQPGYLDMLFSYGVPVVMTNNRGRDAVMFPFGKVNKIIGREYLTSSIAYMISMAILEKPDEIGLWGVDLSADNDEYFHQTPCINAWLGVAIGLGIKLTVPKQNSIFNSTWTYGQTLREDITKPPFTQASFRDMEKTHAARVAQLQGQIDEIQKLMHTHEGSRQAYDHLAKVARAIESGQGIDKITDTAYLK